VDPAGFPRVHGKHFLCNGVMGNYCPGSFADVDLSRGMAPRKHPVYL
jgi:hypothetical protein